MNLRRMIGFALFSIVTTSNGDQALAGLMVRYSADAGGIPSPDTIVEQPNGIIDFNGGDGSTQPSFDPNNPTVQSVSFIVGARHGAVRAASLAVLSGGESYSAGASVTGSASFEDTLTVNAPGMTGQNGSMQVSMVLDGVLSESIPANETSLDYARATVNFSLWATSSLGSPTTGVSYGQIDAYDGFSVQNELYDLSIPFVFGEAFTIGAFLNTSSTVQMPNFPGSTSAISAFAQTALWQGIASVEDSTGTEVLDYAVSAESLTDYRGPITIPEPGTLALAPFCLFGVLHVRRTMRPALR
jgi:hypothetical protein